MIPPHAHAPLCTVTYGILRTRSTKQNNELCVTEFLTGVEGTTGNLTLANIEALGTNLASGSSLNLPSNVTCSNCVKAAYSIVNKDFAGLVPSGVSSYFQSTCGSSFTGKCSPPREFVDGPRERGCSPPCALVLTELG